MDDMIYEDVDFYDWYASFDEEYADEIHISECHDDDVIDF